MVLYVTITISTKQIRERERKEERIEVWENFGKSFC